MGARLGRYEVLKHLASGGMADVLLGRTEGIEGFERHVVLKRIKPGHVQDLRFIRMFLDEARVAANLHHQHIVQVHDIGESAGEYFIAMEYLHGEDVRTILSTASRTRQHVPLGYAMAIVSAAAAGLHYAHERRGPDKRPLGIVHRDISPSNILVGYDGSIKVVDFGIAKASARQETRTGSLKGKVSYMSPEQCKSAEVDRRSDVYSLGVVLYELATTTRLFKGANDYLVMDQIVNGRVTLPRARRSDLPNELSAIIMRAIAPDPERRFATADELRLAIDYVADKLGLTASSSAIAAYMRQQFGDKPEPWLDLGGQVVASLDGMGSAGSRPVGGWTELWRSDASPRGSGPVPRPSGPLGTGVGEISPRAADEPSVPQRAEPRASTAPTDAKMGWESQRPVRTTWAVTLARAAVIAAPLIASIGFGIWWLTGAEAPPIGGAAVAPAATNPSPALVPAPLATPAPDPAPVHAPAAETAPAEAPAGRTVAHAHSDETSPGAPSKRSPRRASAAKVAEAAAPASAPVREPPDRGSRAPQPAAASSAPVAASAPPTLAPGQPPVAPPAPTQPPAPAASAAPAAPAPAAPAPPLVVDAPPAQLSHALVERVAAEHSRELSKCDGGEELRGEISVRFSVDAAGKVSKAQVATMLRKPQVAACILRSVQKWQFPPQPGAGALGTYTLSFQ
jgi:serine/threonine protein kinase